MDTKTFDKILYYLMFLTSLSLILEIFAFLATVVLVSYKEVSYKFQISTSLFLAMMPFGIMLVFLPISFQNGC